MAPKKPAYKKRKKPEPDLQQEADNHNAFETDDTEADRRYRALFNNPFHMSYILDKNLRFVDMNDLMMTQLGLDKDRVGKTGLKDIIHPDDFAKAKKLHRESAIKAHAVPPVEIRMRACSGKLVWVEAGSVLLDGDKTKHRTIGIARDITAREKSDQELFRIRKAVENSSDAIGMSDPEGHHFYQNRAFTELFGFTADELYFLGGGRAIYADLEIAEDVFKTIMSGHSWTGEVDMVSKNQRKFTVFLRADAIQDDDGKLIGLIGVHTDITERKKAVEILRASEEKYRLIAENTSDVIWTIDHNFKYTYMSPAVQQLRGYSPEEAMKQDFEDIMTPSSLKAVESVIAEGLIENNSQQAGQWHARKIDLEVKHKDGSTVWTEVTMTILRNPETQKLEVHGITHDISHRKKVEEELARMAYRDMLTGLYNRKAFLERLEEALSYAKRYQNEKAIFFLDLDNFKKVNDIYGHETGDKLLKDVAARLKESFRETDYIFRFGGDEFTIILNNPAHPLSDIVARRIMDKISMPYQIDGITIDYITSSIGISVFPEDGNDADTLIRNADTAMYAAKKSGNTYTRYSKLINGE